MNHHNTLQSAASWCRSLTNLRASSPGRSGGGEEKEGGASDYKSRIWIPHPILLWLSPSNELSDFRQISAKRKRARMYTHQGVMTLLLISSSPISILHLRFEADIQISETYCKLSFLILSTTRTARTACSRHVPNIYSSVFLIFTDSYSSTEGSATGVAGYIRTLWTYWSLVSLTD